MSKDGADKVGNKLANAVLLFALLVGVALIVWVLAPHLAGIIQAIKG